MGTLTQSTVTLQGLINSIPNLAPLASPTLSNPTLTGNAVAPTQLVTDNSAKIATTNYVKSQNANIVTTTFYRTDNVASGTPIPVTITINGVASTGLTITKNAAGDILTMSAPDVDANALIVYDRVNSGGNTVDAAKTTTQNRTLNIGGTTIAQSRTITRNSLREVIAISLWA